MGLTKNALTVTKKQVEALGLKHRDALDAYTVTSIQASIREVNLLRGRLFRRLKRLNAKKPKIELKFSA